MLKEILAITGKPGLFKIANHGSKTIIVEDMLNGKRFPISMRDKVVSLADIAMYTENGEKPLGEVLDIIYSKEGKNPIDVKAMVANGGLKDKFGEFVEDFDRDRVHDSDIKKLFSWYNLLVSKGYDKFTEEKEEEKEDLSDVTKEETKD